MKYAPIANSHCIPILDAFGSTFQFALAQYVEDDPQYSGYYRGRHFLGDYVIMDNGACEIGTLSIEELIKQALKVGADEVVVPDVLRDRDATEAKVDAAMIELRKKSYPFKLMMVPQGQSVGEWERCLYYFIRKYDFRTIGIPKHCETFPGGRMELLRFIYTEGLHLKYDIHMLGIWGDPWKEIDPVVRDCPWVRSVDSAVPFAYAQKNWVLKERGLNPHVAHDWDAYVEPEVALTNCTLMRMHCHAAHNGS